MTGDGGECDLEFGFARIAQTTANEHDFALSLDEYIHLLSPSARGDRSG